MSDEHVRSHGGAEISVELLEGFLAVIRYGAISRASAALRRSPKAVAKDLDRLERAVGLLLTNRTRHGVTATPAGAAYAREAEKVLVGIVRSGEAARAASRPANASLRVGHLGGASTTILRTALLELCRTEPTITVDLHIGISTELLLDLEMGSLDLAICRPLGANIRLVEAALIEESVLLALPSSHRLAQRKVVAVRDLDSLNFIGASGGTVSRGRITNVPLYQRLGFEPHWSGDTAADPGTMLLLVAASRGVCMVSSGIAETTVLPDIVFRPLDPPITIPLNVVRRASDDTVSSPGYLDQFVELLHATASWMSGW